jgi:hypothetical protein
MDQSRKTTLRDLLLQLPPTEEATQTITARVTAAVRNPTTFMALIDGRGEAFGQQFEVARYADIVLVLLDHNLVDGQTTIGPGRLDQHKELGNQVRLTMAEEWKTHDHERKRRLHVHILLNKADEWETGGKDVEHELMQLLESEEALWKSVQGVESVTTARHSNIRAADIARLAMAIRDHWNVIQGA